MTKTKSSNELVSENELKVIRAELASQAKEEFKRWQQSCPTITLAIVEAGIRLPQLDVLMKIIWEQGYIAGAVRYLQSEGNDE